MTISAGANWQHASSRTTELQVNALNDSATGPYKVNSLRIDPRADPMAGAVRLGSGALALEWRHAARRASCSAPSFFTWGAFAVFLVLLELTMCTGPFGGLSSPPDPSHVSMPEVAGALAGVVGHAGRHARSVLGDPVARLSRLGAAPTELPPVPAARPGHAEGRVLESALPLEAATSARLRSGPRHRRRPRSTASCSAPGCCSSCRWPWCCMRSAACRGWCGAFACASTTGVSMHWFVGYICHSHGPQSWIVNHGAIQAHNVPWAAIPSMGESWHNNHHAFPASARHGLYPGQIDIGFHFVRLLERAGLASDIQTPLACRRARAFRASMSAHRLRQ